MRKPQRSVQIGSGGIIAESVCRITNLEESFSSIRRHAAPRSHIGCEPSGAVAVAVGIAAAGASWWRRLQAQGPGGGARLRGCKIRDCELIDQEGTEIVRKLLGLALAAGIVVGVKKYLDNNPEANRQVKEQANKAMAQAKHLAEGAGEKIKARTSRAQDQVDSFTDSGIPGSTSSTSSATTPNDPATGAPTTL